MSLSLLWPVGLLALAAWALPLILHLQRRQMRRVTRFAALRWLAGPPQAQRSLQIERPWLLLLRLILLGALALLMAQPLLRGDWRRAQDWVVVVPGVDRNTARAALAAPEAEWRWLSPGFPGLESSTPARVDEFASLLRELDTDLPDAATLHVVAPAWLDGLDGERIALSRAIRWTVIAHTSPAIPDASSPTSSPTQLAVRYDGASAEALRYVRAAVQAWNAREPDRYRIDIQSMDRPVDRRSAWLLWLGAQTPATIDAWIAAGGTAVTAAGTQPLPIVLWRDEAGEELARGRQEGKGRRIELTRPWQPARWPLLLDPRFAGQLLALFLPTPPAPDRATTAPALARAGAVRATPAGTSLDTPLGVLIALLFLVERYVATHPRVRR